MSGHCVCDACEARRALEEDEEIESANEYADGRFYRVGPSKVDFSVVKKCECGAEATGYNSHSKWCAKHE